MKFEVEWSFSISVKVLMECLPLRAWLQFEDGVARISLE